MIENNCLSFLLFQRTSEYSLNMAGAGVQVHGPYLQMKGEQYLIEQNSKFLRDVYIRSSEQTIVDCSAT
jgi:hypothetical protein